MDRRAFLGTVAGGSLASLGGCLFGPPDTSSVPDAGGPDTAEPTETRSPTRTATPTATTGDETTSETTTGDGGETRTATATATPTRTTQAAQGSVEVLVGEGGTFYDPEEFTLVAGGTVEWVWRGSGHNVIVENQPDGASWTGTAGPDSKVYDAGHTYSYTFDVPGDYRYYCYNHRVYGMVGTFTVVEG